MTAVLERQDRRVVCERCLLAEAPFARMRGLLGRDRLERGEGLLLRPASSIHTFFMRFPIDAVWLDRNLLVVGVTHDIAPWRTAAQRGARAVLELPAGEAAVLGLEPGEKLILSRPAEPVPAAHAA
ncbi:MAG: DUF192 domain-containing protein [Gaiellaceae bacterium]